MYEHITVTELPDSEIELTGEIPLADVARHHARALREVNDSANIPGFRRGHVPEDILIRNVGEAHIMEKTAEFAFAESYQKIIAEKNLAVLGSPHLTITKLAHGNPIGFKIKVALFPSFTLPDYKSLAKDALVNTRAKKKPADIDVSDAEVEQMLAHFRPPLAPEEVPKGDVKGKEPSPLTDEDVKKFGNFNDLTDFKARLKSDLLEQKKRKAREEVRGAIAERIIEKTNLPLPPVLVESELKRMFAQFQGDIERMGVSFDDYLIKIKKTKEELEKEWRPNAEKRAKMQLIWQKIAEVEHLAPSPEEVELEVKHFLEQHHDINPANARPYITELLQNEKVFAFLES